MTFTARQIAQALGRSRQWSRHALADVAPSGAVSVGGNEAASWEFCTLPGALQSERESIAQQRGFADARALLACEQEHQQAARQANQEELDDAKKLCAVFEPFLRIKDTDNRTQAEKAADGSAAYHRVFGEALCGRWFHELFARINRQDAGRNDFQNPKTYLGIRATQPSSRRKHPVNRTFDHTDLSHGLEFKDPAKPTLTERQNAFEYSFGHFEALLAAHPAQRIPILQSLHRFSWSHASAMSVSFVAFKRNWHRKYEHWQKHGRTCSAVADLRPLNSGSFCLVDLEADLQLIVADAFHLDGKLSIAIRKLLCEGKLSRAFIDRYTLDVYHDSRTPHKNCQWRPGSVPGPGGLRLLQHRTAQFNHRRQP